MPLCHIHSVQLAPLGFPVNYVKMDSGNILEQFQADDFKWPEYSVFVSILVASLGIGVYFGFFDNKNKTNEEFLLAGRSMSTFPVAMSLVCSFISAITLLGQPAEIFYYGLQYSFSAVSIIPMTIVLSYLYVPVYCDLQLTSAYQYLEWRFGRKVRMLASTFSVLYLLLYMPTSVLGPSLALDQVAGIHYGIIAATTFIVCTIYSSIGGLKAVLWTDTLQALVMLLSIFLILGFGIHEVGGISFIWSKAREYDRLEIWNWDFDPRTRYTVWSTIIGELFTWLSLFGASQAQIQRYNSVPSLRAARITLIFNMIGMMVIIGFTSLIGLIIFSRYYNCDPVSTEAVDSSDQLLPFFVMHVLGKYSGVPGLLVAGLTCGSLSTVSSALNALSAIITVDFVKKYRPNSSEERLAIVSKLISLIGGLIALGLVFIIAIVNESVAINPFATFLIGSLMGPILGMFTLGLFFPWANEMGTALGVLIALLISGFVGLGSVIESLENNLPNQRLNFGDCLLNGGNETGSISSTNHLSSAQRVNTDWKAEHADDSFLLKLFSMSFLYQTALATLGTVIFGLICSFIRLLVQKRTQKKINIRLLSRPLLKLWVLIFGKKRMSRWVDFEPAIAFGEQVKSEERNGSAHVHLPSEDGEGSKSVIL